MFDWNGTLLNDFSLHLRSLNAVLARFNIPLLSTSYAREIVMKSPEAMVAWFHTKGVPPSRTLKSIRALRDPVIEEYWNTVHLTRGAREMLDYCKSQNMKIAIVSGARETHIARRLKELEIEHYFNQVVGNVWGKKTTAMKSVLKQFGINHSEAFYVDDTYDGIQAAHLANVYSFGLTQNSYHSSYLIEDADPTYVVESFAELLEILKRGG